MTRRTTRSALLARTALASTFALMVAGAAAPALAQSTNAGTVTSVSTNGGSPAFSGATSNTGGADTSTITLGGSRTILNWDGLNLTSGDTLNFVFGSKGDIVLNRVGAGSASIDGIVNGYLGATGGANGGNVWFLASDGVVFGNNAQVNVGGLLATTANLADADFLDGDMNFAFSGASANPVQVLAGADLRAWGGALALVSQSVSTASGATIGSGGVTSAERADGQVLYGAATNFNITFAPEADNDLSLVSFQVPTAADGSSAVNPLMLGAATEAGDIYLAAVSRAEVVGAMVNFDGGMTAVSATPGENGSIVLGAGRSAGVLDLASDGAEILARFANADPVQAGGDLTLASNGELRLGAGSGAFSAGGDAALAGKRISFLSPMSISVGGDYSITAEEFSEMFTPGTGMFAPTFTGGGAHNFSITDTAGGLFVGDLNTSANLSITTQNGNLSVNGVTTTGNLTLNAGTGMVNGNSAPISVGGHYSVTGGDFTGGVFDPVFTGVGNHNFSITDTVGGLYYGWGGKTFSGDVSVTTLNGGGLTINGDLTSTGGNIILAGDGGLTLQNSLTVGAGQGVYLSAANGSISQTGGAITAGSLQASGEVVQLTSATNNIDALHASSATLGNFRLYNTGDLAVLGTIDGGSELDLSTTGALTANASTLTAANNVVLGGGSLTLNGTAVDAGAGFIANGPITFNGGASVTSGGLQSYTGAVTLGSSTTLTSTGAGDIHFASTLNGGHGLTVSTGGTTMFGGAVGATTALSFLTVTDGIAEIYGGQIRTSGAQTYNGRLWLMGNATLTSTAAGDISFGGDVGAGNSSYGLTVNTSGATRFNSTVGSLNKLGALTTDAGGTTVLNGRIDVVGAVTFGDAVALAAGTYSITGGDVTFNDAVDALNLSDTVNLTVTANGGGANNVTFASTLGASRALDTLTVNGPTTLGGSGYNTTAAQTWNGAVTLSGAGTKAFSGGAGSVSFNNTLDGGSTVNVNAAGGITFGGLVGGGTRLTALNTSGGGVTNLNGGFVATTGAQSYSGSVVLGGDTILDALSAGIIFNAGITGPFALELRTPADSFLNGAVNVASLTTDAGGNTRINNTAGVTTSGDQSYGDNVVLGANTTLTGEDLSYASVSGSGRDLTLNFSGATAISGATTVGVRNLTTGAGGTTTLAGAITTTGTQSYNDTVSLGGTTALTSAGVGVNGNITLNVVTGNGFDLDIDGASGSNLANPTTVTFNGPVSGVALLDVDAGVVDVNAAISAGAISLTALHGGIGVDADVTASAGNTLDASGAITGPGRVGGSAVALIGAAGVGTSSTPLNTAATTLTVRSSGGDVFVSELNGVTVQDAGALTNQAAGSFSLTSGGAMSVNGAISGTNGVTLATTAGNLSFTGGGQITAVSGDIHLTAADALVGGGGVNPLVAQNIFLTADDWMNGILGAASLQEANNLSITDTQGGLTISAMTGLSAANGLTIETTNGGGLSVGGVSAPGFITLISGSGLTLTDNINGGAGLVTLMAGGTARLAAGTINQTGGVITAGLLGGSSGAGSLANLSQANNVASLGDFTTSGFSFTNAGALSIIGAVNGGAGGVTLLAGGDITLTAPASIAATNGPISLTALGAGADLLLNGEIYAGTGTLTTNAGAQISQGAGGTITTGRLTGGAGAGAAFNGVANQVASLGDFTTGTAGAGGFLLVNGASLSTVAGTTVSTNGNPLELRLLGAGADLMLNGTLDAGASTVALNVLGAGGDITQSGGAIRAASLTGQSTGSTTLASSALGGNDVAALGAFTANGFSFAQDGGFSVDGAVSGGTGGVTLNSVNGGIVVNSTGSLTAAGLIDVDSGGALQIGGAVTGGAAGVDLQSAGLLSTSGTGQVTATGGTLRLASTGGGVAIGAGVSNTGGAVAVGAAGDISLQSGADVTGSGEVRLTAGGEIDVTTMGTVISGQNLILTAANFTGSSLTDATLQETGDLSITDTAGGLTMGDLSAAGNLTVMVQNGGGLTGGVLSAGTDLSVNASAGLDLAGLSAGRDASLLAETGGILILARPTIGRNYFVRAADFVGNALNPAFDAVTGGDFTVEDTAGGLAVGALGARGNLTVRVENGGHFLLDPGSSGLTSQTGDITVITEGGGALQLMGDVLTANDRTVALVSSGALAQLMGRINTGTLTGSGAANVGLTSATNDIDRLGSFSAGGLFTLVDTGGLTVDGTVSAAANATVRTVGGDLTLAAGGRVTGALVQLATDQDFHNLRGADAVAASSRWLIYSAGPDGNTFGGLDSGNTAVWGRGFGAAPSQAGNRYVFAVAPTVTFTSTGGTKTYGDDGTSLMGYTVSGLHAGVAGAFQGDTLASAFSGSAALSSAGTAERASVAGGPYEVTVSAGDLVSLAGYAMAFDSAGRIVVTPKAITGTVAADDKTYDGTQAGTGTISLTGVVSGDSVTVGGATFTFADKNAGADKVVTISGASLTGADAGNYTLTLPATALADIFRKALTGTVVADDKTYDGTLAGTGTVTLGGVVDGDTVSVGGTTFTFVDKNAGADKVVTVSGATLSGTDAGNYTLSLPATVLADIFRKAITGTVVADDKTYDGTTAGTGTVTLAGLVDGDAVSGGATFTFADKNAGADKVVTVSGVTLSGTDAGNYTLTVPASVLADIARRALTVAANDLSKRRGEADPALTWTLTSGALVEGDSMTGALVRAPGEALGQYAIGQGSLAASSNYVLTFVPGTFEITAPPVDPGVPPAQGYLQAVKLHGAAAGHGAGVELELQFVADGEADAGESGCKAEDAGCRRAAAMK